MKIKKQPDYLLFADLAKNGEIVRPKPRLPTRG